MFNVSEITEKIGKTKNSVYKKTNKLKVELKPHKKKLNGVVYYDEKGFEIIKNSYGETVVETINGETEQQITTDKYIELLLSEKERQIIQLTKQLEDKNNALIKALDIADRTQHLLAIEKQHVLQLQEPPVKKSFWDRLKKSQTNEN